MKKISIMLVVLALATVTLFVVRHRTVKVAFLEWYELTPQTRDAMQPLFEPLPAILIEAFVSVEKPHAYADDPRLANIPEEKRTIVEQKVVAVIAQSLQAEWNKKITQLYAGLLDGQFPAGYLAVAKDNSNAAIGFILLKEANIKELMQKRLLTVTEGSLDNLPSGPAVGDEVFVDLLAVKPGIQKKGVGKVLLFAVFDHCPHIKKIYLTTSSGDFNKNTQGFYEHVGFTRVLKGVFVGDESEPDFVRKKILYRFDRP